MLRAGKTPSDGEVHLTKGKSVACTRAYHAGHVVRAAIVASGFYGPKELRIRTWADGEGYRWALAAK